MKTQKSGHDLKNVLKHFRITGQFVDARPFGAGHINDTFLMRNKHRDADHYLLQRVNHHVFKNIPRMMDNIGLITNHIRKQLQHIPGSDPHRQCMTFLPAIDGNLYFEDRERNFWRVCLFIPNSHSFDRMENSAKAWQGGKAFGQFQKFLTDVPADQLHETIPFFHDVEKRLQTFSQVVKNDPVKRVRKVSQHIKFIENRSDEMRLVLRMAREHKIHQRITHNDTKFNNILFDKTEKALCVVDLDTTMPGYVHYDFGDAIRTGCNTGAEDDANLENIRLDIDLFSAYTHGFLTETISFLTDTEVETLAFSAKLLTFIMALRFLTDYIDGDNYYKIQFEGHNLQRANAQFRLLEKMEEQFERMQEIVLRQAERVEMGGFRL
ncbi:MAG: aminoglycoside phosphotransferase family protein [Calditrichaeota bacterium]|nr:MAG: aminoglycoside phosphotransferase family protein [Calditrichota bacterium]